MAKRCINCGRPMADNEGFVCSSRCADEYEERHPGELERLAKEHKTGPMTIGVGLAIFILMMTLGSC